MCNLPNLCNKQHLKYLRFQVQKFLLAFDTGSVSAKSPVGRPTLNLPDGYDTLEVL